MRDGEGNQSHSEDVGPSSLGNCPSLAVAPPEDLERVNNEHFADSEFLLFLRSAAGDAPLS